MKTWQPISNGGKFYIQFTPGYALHEDLRGLPIHYRSIENARKAADELNELMRHDYLALVREAHASGRYIDRINGDTSDNRLANLRVVTAANR